MTLDLSLYRTPVREPDPAPAAEGLRPSPLDQSFSCRLLYALAGRGIKPYAEV